ncbi:uncharacterized protein LOC132309227 [Cornus florida]|uniref:uncharacterized protein LOC132309227 n=1 Tax=Cornus florida TaxID=4283 RepID=UPI0028A1913A|nr:uncharacterized protein LOC132309227 [Cornus florida]
MANTLGKIWIGWNKVVFYVILVKEEAQTMLLKVKHFHLGLTFWVSSIYAANTVQERKVLWSDLKIHASLMDEPWLALGDWNMVHFHKEKLGGLRVTQANLDEVNLLVKDLKMEDIPINNGTCFAVKWHMDSSEGPKPFKFLKIWCLQHEVEDVIAQAWSCAVSGNPFHQLQRKLREIKAAIKLQLLNDHLNQDLIDKERALSLDLQHSCDLEEVVWAQKSRLTWLKEGDKCSAFFHNVVK